MGIKVKGLDKAIADLNIKKQIIVDSTKDVLAKTATDVEIEATRNAPKSYQIGDATINLSFIPQKINKRVFDNGLYWSVGLDVPATGEQWEAWMEFGTGLSASQILSNPQYSQEVRNIARTFYRNGQGRIIGRPYLMPAFYRNADDLVNELVKEIKNALK